MAFNLAQVRAGGFDRRIHILRQSTALSPSFEPQETYAKAFSLWAKVFHERVSEVYKNQGIQGVRTTTFTVRYRADITEKDRIEHENQVYKILGFMEMGRKEILEITTQFVEGA